MTTPEHSTRLSLASRLRGWKDEGQGLEQRLKDLETFARSLRRRWVMVGGGFVMGLLASLAYLGACPLHAVLYGGPGALTTEPVLETVLFIAVAMALKSIPATLIERIRRARSVMGEAEQGYLAVRAAAGQSDELGFLEKSFNRMLEEIGATISTVQREADEVAAFAEQLAASAEELHATSGVGTPPRPALPA